MAKDKKQAGADDFFELYKHPEWQKKRLRIMERDGFRCRECGDKETTLNVHHSYYTKGAKPWEYPDESLRTLCEECHEKRHDLLDRSKQALGLLDTPFLRDVFGYAKGLLLLQMAIHRNPRDVSLIFETTDEFIGLAAAFHMLSTTFANRLRFPTSDSILAAASAHGRVDAETADRVADEQLSKLVAAMALLPGASCQCQPVGA